MEVVLIYYNISRQENTQLLQKLEAAVKKVTSYFTKETITDECKHTAADERLSAFHTIKRNHSF
jgi:hypothetical protein